MFNNNSVKQHANNYAGKLEQPVPCTFRPLDKQYARLQAQAHLRDAEEVGSGHVTCNFFCGLSKIYIVLPIANVWRNFSALFCAILWADFNSNTIN